MTPRERVLAVLEGRRPDRVPWFGDLDYWATALVRRGERPPDFKASPAYLDWHRELGVGFYLQGYFPFRTLHDRCRVTERREGHLRIRRVATPRGDLEEVWRTMPESFCEAPISHLVRSARDLPALRYLYENTRYEPDYGFARERLEQVGDAGVVLGYLPKSPFMQLVVLEAGIETVTELHAREPSALADLLEVMRESHDRAARISLESPAEVLMIPENLSSEMVGPRFFEAFMRSYHESWAGRIRAAGKHSFVHLDGTLRGLLREAASTGIAVLEALTPAPVGDLPVEDWARVCGNPETVLWGGLPGSYFTPVVDDAEFDRHVREVLAVMKAQPRYVLGVADQVPPDALERRVRRVRDLVEDHG